VCGTWNTISISLNFNIKKETVYTRLIWQYQQADFIQFKRAIEAENFDECFESGDVNEACSYWTKTFLNIARTYVPNKVITVRPNDSP